MKNKKMIIIGSILLVAVAAAVTIWFLSLGSSSKTGTMNNPVTDNKVTDKDQPLTNGSTGNKDKTLAPATGSDTNNSASPEKPLITRAEVSNGYIRVSATLAQPSNGTCVLTLERTGATTITKTANIIVGPSYYTCDGFRFPATEATSGTWTVTVLHRLNGQDTPSNSVNLTIP